MKTFILLLPLLPLLLAGSRYYTATENPAGADCLYQFIMNRYGSTLGLQIMDVPIIIGLNWVILIMASCDFIMQMKPVFSWQHSLPAL